MGFNFSIEDFMDFDEEDNGGPSEKGKAAALRETGKETGGKNMRTTASDHGYSTQQASITSIGSLLMGIPLYKDPRVALSQQDYLLSNLLGGAITGGEEKKLGSGFDELVPGDITKAAKGINSRRPGTADTTTSSDATDSTNTDVSAVNAPKSSSGYIWPIQGKPNITSPYGMRNHPRGGYKLHKGIDISIPVGAQVFAVKSGTAHRMDDPGGAGWYVKLVHDDGMFSQYFHLSKYSAADGAKVPQGALLGLSGGAEGAQGAGNSTGPHLHFEIRNPDNNSVDPVPLMPKV